MIWIAYQSEHTRKKFSNLFHAKKEISTGLRPEVLFRVLIWYIWQQTINNSVAKIISESHSIKRLHICNIKLFDWNKINYSTFFHFPMHPIGLCVKYKSIPYFIINFFLQKISFEKTNTIIKNFLQKTKMYDQVTTRFTVLEVWYPNELNKC